ncbi:CGNR zinc finger domain-containing protein [Paenibacillus sp. GCM10027627]|uniref:CGNR zinc finger domain-containing protein n=1 Tax=unclassified Paenibacillus TaxID=185978 RepID=UPI0036410419
MAELWIDYANSLHHDWKGDGEQDDRLQSSEWRAAFLQRQQLVAPPIPPTVEELEDMTFFRSDLRRFAQELAEGGDVSAAMIECMNARLQRSAVVRKMILHEASVQMELIPVNVSWENVLSEVASSFAVTLQDGLVSRIRICGNSNCNWVFLDDTRNRSKKFCDDKLCGNLMKVRRFRERKKSDSHSFQNEQRKEF